MYKKIAELIGNNDKTIYRWKKEGRPIISLLEKYFSKEDLEEFLQSGKIQKFEYVNSYLHGLNLRCHQIYHKIQKMEIEHKNSGVDYESGSVLESKNLYRYYLSPFLRKNKVIIKKFTIENFKADFISLALSDPLEFKRNGIPEPLVTFQILSILNELSSSEMHYFFNKFDKIIHDDLADLS